MKTFSGDHPAETSPSAATDEAAPTATPDTVHAPAGPRVSWAPSLSKRSRDSPHDPSTAKAVLVRKSVSPQGTAVITPGSRSRGGTASTDSTGELGTSSGRVRASSFFNVEGISAAATASKREGKSGRSGGATQLTAEGEKVPAGAGAAALADDPEVAQPCGEGWLARHFHRPVVQVRWSTTE